MKVLLVLGLLALLLVTPGVSASDPVCQGEGPKACAVGIVRDVMGGCNPLYDYVQECDPEETS